MKRQVLVNLMLLIIIGVTGLPEFSLFDWFLSPGIKYAVISGVMFLFSLIFFFNYSFSGGGSVFLFGLFLYFLITVLQILRATHLQPINALGEFVSLAHYFFTLILLLYVLALHKYQARVNQRLARYILMLCLALVPLSFFAYLFSPSTSLSFYDHSGHYIRLVYGSLSSSVNNLSGFSFPRLSLVFDEPGTFGALMSLVLGFLLAGRQVNHKMLIFIFVVGAFSISMSYFIVVSIILLLYFSANIVPLLLRGDLYTVLSLFFVSIILFVLFQLLKDSVLASYVTGRLTDILQGNHNRASGNEMALSYALVNPLGLPSSAYDDRLFPSSGMFVVTAYKGWIFTFAFVFTYILFFLKLHLLGYRVRYLVISIIVLLFTRNNLFNVSGAYLITIACIISIVLGSKYDRKS